MGAVHAYVYRCMLLVQCLLCGVRSTAAICVSYLLTLQHQPCTVEVVVVVVVVRVDNQSCEGNAGAAVADSRHRNGSSANEARLVSRTHGVGRLVEEAGEGWLWLLRWYVHTRTPGET